MSKETSLANEAYKKFAHDTLQQLEKIALAAHKKLADFQPPGPTSMATINTLTSPSAVRNLDQIGQASRQSYQELSIEPAIARVEVIDENKKRRLYYICRGAPIPINGIVLASYNSFIGRLAALPVGSELTIKDDVTVEIVEQAKLKPKYSNAWDAYAEINAKTRRRAITIASLQALLHGLQEQEKIEDILGQIQAEAKSEAILIEGIRRSIISKMGLRDQPILDQYQDKIFRMPLNKQLFLMGPPGTGKTTTLIRRLGQKSDTSYLEEDERNIVKASSLLQTEVHNNSWLMFTPTELLRQYLKEAFARENIAASDRRVRTWQDYQRDLARRVFNILKSASGNGNFVMKDIDESISTAAIHNSISWYEDFDNWQQAVFFKELRTSAMFLKEGKIAQINKLGHNIHTILERVGVDNLASVLQALAKAAANALNINSTLKKPIDTKIDQIIQLQLNTDKEFLNALTQYLRDIKEQVDEEDDLEALEADEEIEFWSGSIIDKDKAVRAYRQAIRTHAYAKSLGKTLNKKSRNGKIIEWLDQRLPTEQDQIEIGESLVLQSHIRAFTSPIKLYMNSMPKRYRAFRRTRLEENSWYVNKNPSSSREIHSLEIDIILLSLLRTSHALLYATNVVQDIGSPIWSCLKPVLDLYKNQIMVDEATDFSPIQLACMTAMTNPQIRSFFACGDFNQRLTIWGTQSPDDLEWALPNVEIQEVTISYRQSAQLNDLARAIIHATDGPQNKVTLAEDVDNNGVEPALIEYTNDNVALAKWLAQRIHEIEGSVGQMPSTAIFVNSEDEIELLVQPLLIALAEYNIQVFGCKDGRVVGQDSDIRVFNIQHIKGLEFEAAFYIAIDRLAVMQPELFSKYLYVGATRAATYLGLTCEGALPESLEKLRNKFVPNWERYNK
ncbi:MAG: ATP-binding domain-containing protein [Alphaproteobacteria bacterium]